MNQKDKHIDTQVVHAGEKSDPSTGAIMTPIYATSTYVQSAPGVHKGYEYSRSQNPTRAALERCLAALENGDRGFAFASGLAAVSTVLEMLSVGDHVIASDDLYGGSYRLFHDIREKNSGVSFTFVDCSNLNNIHDAMQENTKMIWVETPSNPMLKLVNLVEIAQLAQSHQLISVADNTFATPIIQQPLNYGFDIVLHSLTKYLNGHSDVIGGALVVKNRDIADQIGYFQNAVGAILGPFDSFLALRGIKTLSLRMERHNQNAMVLAKWLEAHPAVKRIYYPGLRSHPQHALAQEQMDGFGGMISVELKADLATTKEMLSRCQVFTLAESLGGVESLIEHPGIMTHASVPENVRDQLGISDSLIRLSVGIESASDLIADLDQAMSVISVTH